MHAHQVQVSDFHIRLASAPGSLHIYVSHKAGFQGHVPMTSVQFHLSRDVVPMNTVVESRMWEKLYRKKYIALA